MRIVEHRATFSWSLSVIDTFFQTVRLVLHLWEIQKEIQKEKLHGIKKKNYKISKLLLRYLPLARGVNLCLGFIVDKNSNLHENSQPNDAQLQWQNKNVFLCTNVYSTEKQVNTVVRTSRSCSRRLSPGKSSWIRWRSPSSCPRWRTAPLPTLPFPFSTRFLASWPRYLSYSANLWTCNI